MTAKLFSLSLRCVCLQRKPASGPFIFVYVSARHTICRPSVGRTAGDPATAAFTTESQICAVGILTVTFERRQ